MKQESNIWLYQSQNNDMKGSALTQDVSEKQHKLIANCKMNNNIEHV